MAHMDDFNAVLDGTIDDDVTGAGYDEAAMVFAELGTGYSDIWIVRQKEATRLKSVYKLERICGAALSDVVMNLSKVGVRLRRE